MPPLSFHPPRPYPYAPRKIASTNNNPTPPFSHLPLNPANPLSPDPYPLYPIPMISFTIPHRDSPARRGTIATPHGTFETPAFMAVGTRGTIKGITPDQARAAGCQCVLGNTY